MRGWPARVSVVAASLSLLLGAVVITGWHLRLAPLVQVHPALVPMQYNTAFGFLLAGAGLLLASLHRTRATSVCALALGALGLLTLGEYAFGVDLAIDQLLMEHDITVETSHPGRMAPNTALSFLLAASALLLLAWAGTRRALFLAAGITSALILSLGLVALGGYLAGQEAAYGWGRLTRMAVHTAVGFLVVGTGLLSMAAARGANGISSESWEKLRPWGTAVGFSVTVVLIASTMVIAHMDLARLEEAHRARERTDSMRLRVDSLELLMAKAELGQRGFLLSGDSVHLRDYRDAVERIRAEESSFGGDSTTPRIHAAGERLRSLVPAWLEELDTAVVLYGREDSASARSLLGERGASRESIRREIRTISDALRQGAAPVSPRGGTYAAPTRTALLTGMGLSIVLLVGAVVLVFWLERRGAQAAAEARRNQRLFRGVVDHLPGGLVHIFDRDFRYLFNAGEELERLGLSNEALVGKTIFEVLPPDLAETVAARYRRCLDGETVSFEGDFGGESFLVRASPLRGPGGEITRILALSVNVTEPREAREALEASEARFRGTFEQAAVGIAHVGTDGSFRKVNRTFADITGYSVPELMELTFQDITHPEDVEADLAYVERVLAGGMDTDSMETRYIRKNGSLVWILLTVSLIRDRAGEPDYFVSVIQDISIRKEAREELENFTYSVSHDLRAPLRGIDGFCRILVEDHLPELPEEAQHYLGRIQANASQMGTLIDGLLAFSRLGRKPLAKTRVDPRPLVQDVLTDLEADRAGREVDLKIGELPECQADPTLLRQVFANLLGNAFKYTRGRDPTTIEVGWQENGDQADDPIYFVRDDGVGFDMAYAHKLFGMFQRLHAQEEFEGTGVGLATVHRIIQRHGGRVWADGAVGRGATFFFTLGGETNGD